MFTPAVELDELRAIYEAFNGGDLETLLKVSHPDVELHPLAGAVTSTGPWIGHDGMRRLLEDTRRSWYRFELRCDDLLDVGGRLVAFVHVATAADAASPVIQGDVAHVIDLEDGLLLRLVAYRDRDAAVAAAEAEASA